MNACAIANDTLTPTKLGLRILIVDDDIDLLESIYDLLELEDDNFVIQTASDFDSAIKIAENFQPNLALLDIKLGTASGIDLVPVFKNSQPDTVCIMMTAFRDAQYAVDALRSGADDFLYKPVEPELLFKTIQHYQSVQETLREKHLADKRFHAIFENSYDHLFVLDPMGMILDINETALSFYGLDKQNICSDYFTKGAWWNSSPRNISMISSTLNSAIKGEQIKSEFRLRNTDNNEFYFEFNFTPIFDDNGNTAMIIAEGRDITARVKTQENILHINKTLEHRVKQRTHALELSRDEAEKSNQAKTDFLSQMSHELRTPMNAILGFTQIMEANDDEPLQPMQQECVQQVLTAGEHLMSLINQILNLSHIESGKFTVHIEPVSVAETLTKSLALVRPLIEQGQLSVKISTAEDDKTLVMADQQSFLQVVINLLSNAIKFNSPQGSIIINSAHTSDGYLRINVQDTGVGIAKDQYEAVFARFERINNKQSVDGTGIGLNISKHMIEMMGGRIGFDSVKNQGSCFWIELKLAEDNHPG